MNGTDGTDGTDGTATFNGSPRDTDLGAGSSSSPTPGLTWRVHLMRECPERLPWVLAILLAAGALAYVLFWNPLIALAVVAILGGAVGEYLFPIEYRLTPETAEMRNGLSWRRIAWSDVRRTAVLEDGVKLSPLTRPSRLEATRGVFLRFHGNRDAVLAAVERFRNDRNDP